MTMIFTSGRNIAPFLNASLLTRMPTFSAAGYSSLVTLSFTSFYTGCQSTDTNIPNMVEVIEFLEPILEVVNRGLNLVNQICFLKEADVC